MPSSQTLSTKPLAQVPTNDKSQLNDIIDDLLEPFGGQQLAIPLKDLPKYVGTVLKALEVAPKALEILANVTTIEANMVGIARDVYEVLRVDKLECICEELKCTNSLLRQHLAAFDADQRQKLDSVRAIHSGLNQIAVTVAGASQAFSIEELPSLNPNNPDNTTFGSDYILPESTDANDTVKCVT